MSWRSLDAGRLVLGGNGGGVLIYAVFVMFAVFAHSFWFNLLGLYGAGAFLIALTISTGLVWWLRRRAHPSLGRLTRASLPWPVLLYVGLALLSVAWSAWPSVSILTWLLLASATMHGLFLADQFDGPALVSIAGSALRMVMLLSVLLELWVAAVRKMPLLPNFSEAPREPDPHWYWVRGNLLDGVFEGGRVQGIVGNSNLLAVLCLLAMIICAVQLLDHRGHRLYLLVMLALSGWLFIRADSTTMLVALAAVGAAVGTAVGFRVARARRARAFLAVGIGAALALTVAGGVLLREPLARMIGKDATFTGRAAIWDAVLDRAAGRPLFGNGFASPWLPWDKAFSSWISDHGITVFQAHNMWIDVYMQLGFVGLACVGLVFGNAFRNAWRYAQCASPGTPNTGLPRPRSALVPVAIMAILLIQGITESSPIMLWGWTLLTVISSLPKQTTAPESLAVPWLKDGRN